jgi:hypothetical protein
MATHTLPEPVDPAEVRAQVAKIREALKRGDKLVLAVYSETPDSDLSQNDDEPF